MVWLFFELQVTNHAPKDILCQLYDGIGLEWFPVKEKIAYF